MKILSVGNFNVLSNTCLHRHWALEKLAFQIDSVNTRKNNTSILYRICKKLFSLGLPIRLPDSTNANKSIKKLVETSPKKYDIVWIDKGITINAKTLRYIKIAQPTAKIISYTADNMALRHNQSQNFLNCIPLYDHHITTKSNIINDLYKLGAKNVIFSYQSYESSFHYPRAISDSDKIRLGGDVGFIGMWEKERCESIIYLAMNGINVKVFGGGKWNDYKNLYPTLKIENSIFSEDYSIALQSFKIALCFLRKKNADLHTSRSMEIPACGGFMMAEKTTEHEKLFENNNEAVFFSSNEELLKKCRYYLSHPEERYMIIKQGIIRCKQSGYSNNKTLKRIIDSII